MTQETNEDLYKELLERPMGSRRFALPKRIDEILRSMCRRDPLADNQDDLDHRSYENIVSASQASLRQR